MYLMTDSAEIYHKGLHILLHSLNQLIAISISYKYFKNNPLKAQLIAFILVSNEMVREMN